MNLLSYVICYFFIRMFFFEYFRFFPRKNVFNPLKICYAHNIGKHLHIDTQEDLIS